jgi:hypothetical protein
MSDITITPGTWARVRLRDNRPGDGHRLHHPAEDECGARVTAIDKSGDHTVFARYNGGRRSNGPRTEGGLGLGRHFRPDELEAIPAPP